MARARVRPDSHATCSEIYVYQSSHELNGRTTTSRAAAMTSAKKLSGIRTTRDGKQYGGRTGGHSRSVPLGGQSWPVSISRANVDRQITREISSDDGGDGGGGTSHGTARRSTSRSLKIIGQMHALSVQIVSQLLCLSILYSFHLQN